MKLGFLLFEYFPFGGLQRDCLKTALLCASRGHEVSILTRTWQGEKPDGLQVRLLGGRGWTNMARNRHYLSRLRSVLPTLTMDAVIGFNKMPGLDVYFGADPCFVHKAMTSKPLWYRWLPRFRHYASLERAVFARGLSTQILQLTPHEIPNYQRIYGTEDRFHLLPPMVPRHAFSREEQRQQRLRLRRFHGWRVDDHLLLFVGSDFRRKGLDRVIRGVASLDKPLREGTHLVVIGQCKPGRFVRLARRLGLSERVHFLGGRTDVSEWMLACDALVHPAYVETAGAVLLEALTHGLPALTTASCGYAFHIERARAGMVIREPFELDGFQGAIHEMLTSSEKRSKFGENALAYAAREDLYHCHQKAADIIEVTAMEKSAIRNRTTPL